MVTTSGKLNGSKAEQWEVKILLKQSKRIWAYLPMGGKSLKMMEAFSFEKGPEPILSILTVKKTI